MSRYIDLTGKIFGRLQVVSSAGRNKHGAILWKCSCSCGNKTIVVGNSLRLGSTKSCGCLAKETSAINGKNKRIDLVGKRYNRLVVTSYFGKDSSGRLKWRCKCSCGNKLVVLGNSLRRGLTQSCGCLHRERFRDLRLIKIDRRKKFGRLRVLGHPIKKGIRTFYPCKCDCGNYIEVQSYSLRKGLTRSCGCLQRETITTHGKSQTPAYKKMKGAERRALKHSLDKHYTTEDVEEKYLDQEGLCYYCGVDLRKTGFHEEHKTPLSRGGANDKENICLSCPPCNLRKNTKTEEEFRLTFRVNR